MNDDNLQMGEELRQRRPSLAGKAAALREQFPQLNRASRKMLAREMAFAEQFKREVNE